ncbi:sulfonate ABC transporter permease [Xanthomonas translucens pv. arrhenatheri]|jgi:NitT/TauT family transport system permease protein|uniref:ABC transporter permease n=7 Tax=Xanthomonas translucens group TaxID=3390202 RepID=A0A0K2ZC60_9XANT|nr:ABC transporter permease subunit [Xanthomonas translucens]OAX59293.1 sulfonate ABC transporter permease [Xanthomonas translucens pv. graminis]OAX67648.1 sulfonate ABC transporter permease [Xanthomonas translucens pv. arrhenatheri]UKE55947.1 ABC transporter permease subunit [Xanthomonas translucens pv. graminis]UKE79382.1 ABC transporter permease subunit [Xanthomonas translucens pv. arrhenatheri]WIH07112.1 ABC transporter permease subunit [Xanthomonas translucens pv. graminis]
MVLFPRDRNAPDHVAARPGVLPNLHDLAVFALLLALGVLLLHGAADMRAPLPPPGTEAVSLGLQHLPEYGLRTTLRMFAAMAASLLFTFVVATLAAKSRRAERLIVPALDILQSVPVLGFLTFTVTFFLGLFPGRQIGAELASIFAIFTSQAWNMAYSFYQSLRNVPRDLDEVTRGFGLSSWQRFWRLEAPYATPALIWNMMMSMSGGWFFVVASEAITVGDHTLELPGIGSYLALAIAQRNFAAVGWAVLAMAVLIVLYDQLLFRPIVAWSDKFRAELTASQDKPQSWLYDLLRRTRLAKRLVAPLAWLWQRTLLWRWAPRRARPAAAPARDGAANLWGERLWSAALAVAALAAAWFAFDYGRRHLSLHDLAEAFGGGLATLLRVVVLIALASVVWVPIGVWIGLRPKVAQRVQPLAQFLAAFPANVLFPFAVLAIVATGANPNIWLSPLMILGTQWYILFNVIAGASAFPTDLREAATVYQLRSWTWWRRVILPGIFPYYITGALTASGGSWNASIVAELASWGDTQVQAYGLGSYIARATAAGDGARVLLGVAVMSLFVTVFNRAVWRRLYAFAERRLRFD